MWIVRLALRRPYTFVVAALVLILLSPFILLRTPTDIFPSIDIPVISVIWQYSGLNAQEIEQRILYSHERSLSATVNDIEHIESNSYAGVGIIKVFLREGASVDAGVSQITAVAQTILRQMPPGQTPPLVIRYNASTVPILQYSLSSPTLSEQELYDLGQNQVRIGLSTIQGAQIPWPYGGKTRVVSVDLDLNALKAHHLRPQDVVDAIGNQNLILPGGTAKIGGTEYAVELNGSPKLLDDLNQLPIRRTQGATLTLGEVAHVRDGYLPQQNVVRQDGRRGSLLTIMKSGMASTLDVVRSVKTEMPRILAGLTPELEVRTFADQSLFVRAAISGVLKEAVIAAALTALMILLFLGSWRSTLIIALSIPLSVLCSLAVLSALGETINLMTLGGLALAVGILVDDATVEIENVHRQMDSGLPLEQAILAGAQEIALPALVSTLCICIVFVPMFLLEGVARHLFVPLAEAVVFAMLASYILSRTLIPTLVMWFYRNVDLHQKPQTSPRSALRRFFARIQARFESGFDSLRTRYRSLLATCLEHPRQTVSLFLGLCAATLLLIPLLGEDFFPAVDAGQIRLHLRARSGTRIEETVRLVDSVESVIRAQIPKEELGGILDNIGIPNSGISLSYSNSGLIGTGDADILISLNHGHAPTESYIRRLRLELHRVFPDTTFYFLPADIVSQTLNFGLPAPLDIQIYGRNQNGNRAVAARLAEKIRKIPGAVDVRVQQPADLPRLELQVDRERASELGLSERDVASSVLLSLSGSGQIQPQFWLNPQIGIQYALNVRAPEHSLDSLAALESIPISADSNSGSANTFSASTASSAGTSAGAAHSGGMAPRTADQLLTNVASFRRSQGPAVVSHHNVLPVIDVFAAQGGRDLGSLTRAILPLVEEARKDLPRGSFMVVRGQAETMRQSFRGLGWGLAGALALVYLLLVVNFQSWLDPFIIISALPAALAGCIWALFVCQTPISVPALMGTIMSLGVATANSVLVVSFARERLAQGPLQAALQAGDTRLRAVLMTALAMMLGMLPMSLGLGEGGEQNAPLARAVLGGLFFATIATLFFVPCVFRLLHRSHPSHTPDSPATNPLPANAPTGSDVASAPPLPSL